jgi:hypothetical protein
MLRSEVGNASPSKSVASGGTSGTRQARAPASTSAAPAVSPAVVENWSPMSPNPRVSDASLAFLVQWMNANLFKSPITAFPREVLSSHGRPVYDVIEVW